MSISIDVAASHRHFSAYCFNRVWDLIDKPERTPAEDRDMLALALASLWHWRQRSDVGPRQLSVGCWQVSRVLCLMQQPDLARTFAHESFEHAASEEPFYRGYALEAVARSEMLAGNREAAQAALEDARQFCEQITNADNRAALEADLNTILSPKN